MMGKYTVILTPMERNLLEMKATRLSSWSKLCRTTLPFGRISACAGKQFKNFAGLDAS
jgi:hypothetical protein